MAVLQPWATCYCASRVIVLCHTEITPPHTQTHTMTFTDFNLCERVHMPFVSHDGLSLYARSQNFEKWLLASSCLSVCMEQLGSHCTDFHEILYLRIFRKFVEKIKVSLKSDKNSGHFIWGPKYIFLLYLAQFFLEWEMFRKNVVEKIKTHFEIRQYINACKSDMWLTVHRNSVWIRKTNWMSLFVFFISLLIVSQHVSGNHVPIIRSWRLRDVICHFLYSLFLF